MHDRDRPSDEDEKQFLPTLFTTSVARDSTTGARSTKYVNHQGSPVVVATRNDIGSGFSAESLERLPSFRVPYRHRTHIGIEFLERFPERAADPPVKDHFSRRICQNRHARRFMLDGILQNLHRFRSHYAGACRTGVEEVVQQGELEFGILRVETESEPRSA